MQSNFRKDVTLNNANFLSSNPINKSDVKRKKINGKYVYEKFYMIDFLDIKKNAYIVSSFGRVFSLLTNQEIYGTSNARKNNYNSVYLMTENGKVRKVAKHRLVARAFIPKTASDKKMNRIYVHHKNWDNDYNYYWNLEWRSPLEIIMIGRVQKNKEVEEEDIVKAVCSLLENKETIVDIFDMLDGKISKDKISKIKNKAIYTEISENYEF